MALSALAEYAQAVDGSADLSMRVRSGDIDKTLAIDSSNFDVLQTLKVTPGVSVDVECSGIGMALVVAELRYNVPKHPSESCYDLDVKWFVAENGGEDIFFLLSS